MSIASRVAIQHCVRRAFSMAKEQGQVEKKIYLKLTQQFHPTHLEIINESYKHNVPKGSETHFLVVIVSEQFTGQPLIKRHRAINELLSAEINSSIHALSIQAKSPQQWKKSQTVQKTPQCLGGSKK